MTEDKYILEGHTPKKERDLLKWAQWFETADRLVARTGTVSTVFLGLDHSFGVEKPILFETMVFGGKLDGEQDHYSTWDEAVKGHEAMCQRVQSSDA